MKKTAFLLACIMICTALLVSCGTDNVSKLGPYVPGVTSEQGYYSDWLGLEFVPTANVVMTPKEELYESMEIGADEDDVDWEALDNAYEMMATDTATGSNVIVMTEKLAFKNMSMDKYIELLKKDLEGITEMSVTVDSVTDVEFLGRPWQRLDITSIASGFTIKQVMLVRKVENRILGITITAINEGDEEVLLSCFKER